MKCAFLVTLLFFCSASFGQQTTPNQSSPFVLGETVRLKSVVLAEDRMLNIYLPEDYKKTDTATYPIVYLLDGGADEDFIHITGLYQFNSFPWVNRVSPSIIVGITNVDRRRDMTYPTTVAADRKNYPTSGHSQRFMDFIQQELQPYIEKHYRTNTSKTLIGESLGGLLATEIVLKRPTLFNKYIIVSPSLWWDNGSLLQQTSSMLQSNFVQPTAIYIAVGKEGLTPGNPPRVMEVDVNVLAEKLKQTQSKEVTVYFDYLPEENHATIMHQAVLNALRQLSSVIKKPE